MPLLGPFFKAKGPNRAIECFSWFWPSVWRGGSDVDGRLSERAQKTVRTGLILLRMGTLLLLLYCCVAQRSSGAAAAARLQEAAEGRHTVSSTRHRVPTSMYYTLPTYSYLMLQALTRHSALPPAPRDCCMPTSRRRQWRRRLQLLTSRV